MDGPYFDVVVRLFFVLLIAVPAVWLLAIVIEAVGLGLVRGAGLGGRLADWTLGLQIVQVLAVLAGIVVMCSGPPAVPGELGRWIVLFVVTLPPMIGLITVVVSTILFLRTRAELARRPDLPVADLVDTEPLPRLGEGPYRHPLS